MTGVQNNSNLANSLLQQLLQNIDTGYLLLTVEKDNGNSPTFRIKDANRKFVDFMQMSLVEHIDKKVEDVIPASEKYWFEIMQDIYAEKAEAKFEGYNSKESLYFRITGFRLDTDHIVLLMYDLTDRIRYEEDLKEYNEEIQAQNEEFRALNDELVESYEVVKSTNSKLLVKEKELDESNKMLQLVLDHIPTRVFWKDLDSNYLGCNSVFANDAGKENASGVIGSTDIDLFATEIGNMYRADDKQVMETKEAKLNFEEPQGQEGEELRYLRTNKIPLLNELNEVIGVLGTYEDISALKATQQQLILAKEKAEESDRLKSAFLANMSHEIRTPMNGIIGFTQLLNDPKIVDEDRSYYMNIINEGSSQLLRIVNDIIDISKIESGQIDLFQVDVKIHDLIKEIIEFYTPIANNKNLKIIQKAKAKDELCMARVDETKFRQVIENLLSNAIKFTPQGSIHIDCSVCNSKLCIKVCDTGIGIAEAYHDVVFDRFGQVMDNGIDKYGGTGLGLSICKGYVEKMGGKIWLESEVEKGTCFHVEIPQ